MSRRYVPNPNRGKNLEEALCLELGDRQAKGIWLKVVLREDLSCQKPTAERGVGNDLDSKLASCLNQLEGWFIHVNSASVVGVPPHALPDPRFSLGFKVYPLMVYKKVILTGK